MTIHEVTQKDTKEKHFFVDRLSVMVEKMKLTLYSKPDCPLCDELNTDLDGLQEEFGFTLVEHNIDDDRGDSERYRYLIPVLDIEGGPVLYPPHSLQGTRKALAAAADSSS